MGILCIGGGGISAYFASVGLLGRSVGLEAASVAGQSTGEILVNLAIDLTALIFGVTYWLRESKSREAALARIAANEAGVQAQLLREDAETTRKLTGFGLFSDNADTLGKK